LDLQIRISDETPCDFRDVGYNFPSARALPRTGRRASRNARISPSAPSPPGADGWCEQNKNDGANLTRCRRPGDNSFCNNKFVLTAGFAHAKFGSL
jgi:hypothetical protein